MGEFAAPRNDRLTLLLSDALEWLDRAEEARRVARQLTVRISVKAIGQSAEGDHDRPEHAVPIVAESYERLARGVAARRGEIAPAHPPIQLADFGRRAAHFFPSHPKATPDANRLIQPNKPEHVTAFALRQPLRQEGASDNHRQNRGCSWVPPSEG